MGNITVKNRIFYQKGPGWQRRSKNKSKKHYGENECLKFIKVADPNTELIYIVDSRANFRQVNGIG